MWHRRILTTALAATLAAGAASPAPAKSRKVTQLSCTLQLIAQGVPNPSGAHFGFAACPKPLGKGLHHNSYTVTPTGQGRGTVAVNFKNYYHRGTVSGTAAMTFAATSPTSITYTGTVTYTGGTGRFRRVRGSGTIACTTIDGGMHKSCTVSSRVTGIR